MNTTEKTTLNRLLIPVTGKYIEVCHLAVGVAHWLLPKLVAGAEVPMFNQTHWYQLVWLIEEAAY